MALACYLTDKIAAFGLTGAGPLCKAGPARASAPAATRPPSARWRSVGGRARGAREEQIPCCGSTASRPGRQLPARARVGEVVRQRARLLARAQPAVPVAAAAPPSSSSGWASSRRPPAVGARAQGAAPQVLAPPSGGFPTPGHGYDHDVGFPTTATILPFLFGYRKSALTNPNTYACRSDICGDNGNDLLRAGRRGARLHPAGLRGHRRRHVGHQRLVLDMFDASAVYQCCPPSVAIGPAPEGGFSWNAGAGTARRRASRSARSSSCAGTGAPSTRWGARRRWARTCGCRSPTARTSGSVRPVQRPHLRDARGDLPRYPPVPQHPRP